MPFCSAFGTQRRPHIRDAHTNNDFLNQREGDNLRPCQQVQEMVISSRFLFNYVHALRSFLHRCGIRVPASFWMSSVRWEFDRRCCLLSVSLLTVPFTWLNALWSAHVRSGYVICMYELHEMRDEQLEWLWLTRTFFTCCTGCCWRTSLALNASRLAL